MNTFGNRSIDNEYIIIIRCTLKPFLSARVKISTVLRNKQPATLLNECHWSYYTL